MVNAWWRRRSTFLSVVHLQAIPIQQRPVKVNMLLAKLLQWAAYDKSAIAPLKAVLLECPFNLEAIRGLLALALALNSQTVQNEFQNA